MRPLHEFRVSVCLGPVNLGAGKITLTGEFQLSTRVADFHAFADRVHVAANLLEIERRQIDNRGVFNVRNHQFFGIGLNQSQLLNITLVNVAVFVLETQMRHHPVVVVALVNVHGEGVVVRHRRNHLEQMEGVGANHDLIGLAFVQFEFIGVQHHIHQDRMGLVEIDDADALFGERDGGVRQDIFNGGDHVTNGLNLDSFNGQYMVVTHGKNGWVRLNLRILYLYYYVHFLYGFYS